MGPGGVFSSITFYSMVIAQVLLVLTSSISQTSEGRKSSSPIVIDDEHGLDLLAQDMGWSGDGSPTSPYMIENLTIDASGKGVCLFIGNTTGHIWIRNCTFSNAVRESSYRPGAGIVLWSASNVTMENCTIMDNIFGAYSVFSSKCILANCTMSNEESDIVLNYTDRMVIQNNSLTGAESGLMMLSSDYNIVKNNSLSWSTLQALCLNKSGSNHIIDNTFRDNTDGVHIHLSGSNTFRRNQIDYSSTGLKVSCSQNNVIDSNHFKGNDLAFFLESSNSNSIIKNDYLHNGAGLKIFSSDHNRIDHELINTGDIAIRIINSKDTEVRNVQIINILEGIAIEAGSLNTSIRYCTLDSQSIDSCGIFIHPANVSNTTIEGNAFFRFSKGILMQRTNRTWINRNIIHNSGSGIEIASSIGSNITNNSIWDCSTGLSCDIPIEPVVDLLLIENNTVSDCLTGVIVDMRSKGIMDQRDLMIIGNRIDHCYTGLEVSNSLKDMIIRNLFIENVIGLYLIDGSEDLVYDNYLSNRENAKLERTNGTIWNVSKVAIQNILNGPYMGGNFWSDYEGNDLDGDGIGDENLPHKPGDHLPIVKDVITPTVIDLTTERPMTGEEFMIDLSLDDRPVLDLDVVVKYVFIGTDGKALDAGEPISFKRWNKRSLNVTLNVPEQAVRLFYFVNITDRSGNKESIKNSFPVLDIIAPQVIIQLEGNASTGEDLLLNMTIIENTYNGELEVLYGRFGGSGQGSTLSFGLESAAGTITVLRSIPIALDMVKVQLRVRSMDEALNVFEGELMVINISDTVPPTIRDPQIDIENSGLTIHFNAIILDNIEMFSADISLNFTGGKKIGGKMVKNGLPWEASFPIPLDSNWCNWTIIALDSSGNEALSNGRFYLTPIGPSALTDLTNGTPETGRPFDLLFMEMVGLQVGYRRIDWWFRSDEVMSEWNVSKLRIMVPENASELHYRYTVKDEFGTVVSIEGGRGVLDVILPTVSFTAGKAYNGRTLVVSWRSFDNIGVDTCLVLYRFDDQDWTSIEPNGVDLNIRIPLDAGSLVLEGHVNDINGNTNTTVLERDILDDTPPVLERIFRVFDEKNDTLLVFLICSDNRGLEQVSARWSIGPGRTGSMPVWFLVNRTFQGMIPLAGQEGDLRIEVTLNDTSGNQISYGPFIFNINRGDNIKKDPHISLLVIIPIIIIVVSLIAIIYMALRRNGPTRPEE